MSENKIVVYGTTWCPDCRRSKKFLAEQRIPYRWVDIEARPQEAKVVEELNRGRQKVPTILFQDGSLLVEPSNAELAAKLGLSTRAKCPYYDCIIIGGGPTGLTAALYLAREGVETLVIEKSALGGQIGITEKLENFPGFPAGIRGAELAERFAQQARRFGAELLQAQQVSQVVQGKAGLKVQTADGSQYGAGAILLASGSIYRRLGVPGEEELIGINLHYCATCDGAFYKGKTVAVIGGGNSACEESLFLTKFATQVTLLQNKPELTAQKLIQEKVYQHPQITVRTNVAVQSFESNGKLSALVLQDRRTEQSEKLRPDGVFVFIGMAPNNELVSDLVKLDERGFVVTSAELMTSLPGLFAAGDLRSGSTKQAAAAVGEGATAALMIREYLKGL